MQLGALRRATLAVALSSSLLACDKAADPNEEEEVPACGERLELTDDAFVGGTVLEAGSCWFVTEDLSVADGTVEAEQGVSIHFATDVGVTIAAGGTLRLAGTAEHPVELTTDDPLVTWRGIQLQDSQGSDNLWEHVVLDRAGSENWTGADYSGAAVFVDGSSTLGMHDVTLRDSISHGLLATGDVLLDVTDATFEGNDVPAYLHPDVVHALGSETAFTDNTHSYVRVVFGNTDAVVGDRSWQALAVPYRIEDRFFVEGTLDLQPGVVIEVTQDASLQIEAGARFAAAGTAEEPIVFRGVSSGTRGFWQGISVEAAGTDVPLEYGAVFDHVVIEDAGSDTWSGDPESSAALYLDAASSALITNTTFRNSASYGLWASDAARIEGFADNTFTDSGRVMFLHPDRVGELSGTSTVSGNDDDRIHVVMSNNDTVTLDATWKDLGVPYLATDRFFVDAALTLDPGVTVELDQDVRLIVEEGGSLTANGTAEAPVTLTGAAENVTGFWVGVQVLSNTTANSLTHTLLEYTGSDTWTGSPESDAALYLGEDAAMSLTDVEIGPGGGYGISVDTATTALSCSNVVFTGLEDGAVYDRDAAAPLAGC